MEPIGQVAGLISVTLTSPKDPFKTAGKAPLAWSRWRQSQIMDHGHKARHR